MSRSIDTAESGVPRLALSPDEAAESLGLARSRIYDAIRRQEITVRRDRKRTLIEPSELLRWLRALPVRGRQLDAGPAEAAVGADMLPIDDLTVIDGERQ